VLPSRQIQLPVRQYDHLAVVWQCFVSGLEAARRCFGPSAPQRRSANAGGTVLGVEDVPSDLEVPPCRFASDTRILIGDDAAA
jgi:hypothetical protein